MKDTRCSTTESTKKGETTWQKLMWLLFIAKLLIQKN
jgi:hypothetical protein